MNRFKAIWEWRHYMKNFGWKQQSIPLKNISLRNTGAHGLQNSVAGSDLNRFSRSSFSTLRSIIDGYRNAIPRGDLNT
jgi:hypothetical protein